jgi:hypothetical protein
MIIISILHQLKLYQHNQLYLLIQKKYYKQNQILKYKKLNISKLIILFSVKVSVRVNLVLCIKHSINQQVGFTQ